MADSVEIEICVEAADEGALRYSVVAARQGGAGRIELCAAMGEDGLTPPAELIRRAREAAGPVGVMAMLRPRGGDFCYDGAEQEQMLRQLEEAAAAGANGVVLGVLGADRRVDESALRRLVDAAGGLGLDVTFHRAFDAAPEPLEALEAVMAAGCRRVLSSGCAWGGDGQALDGVVVLRQLAVRAGGALEVLIGGGVAADRVGALLAAVAVPGARLGVHAYSAVRRRGRTDAAKVAALVAAVRDWEEGGVGLDGS